MDFDHGFRSRISIKDFDHGFRSWMSIIDHQCRASISSIEHNSGMVLSVINYGWYRPRPSPK